MSPSVPLCGKIMESDSSPLRKRCLMTVGSYFAIKGQICVVPSSLSFSPCDTLHRYHKERKGLMYLGRSLFLKWAAVLLFALSSERPPLILWQ